QDETHAIVRSFARTADFPVKWVTHPHRGFRAALSRNDGVRATTVPYLVFVDGDCLLPEDHLRNHLLARRPGVVRAGDCLRLDKTATERIDSAAIDSGAYRNWISGEERQRLFQKKLKDRYYQWIRHTAKPKLISCDIGIWRDDFEAVNGFDEQFVGWGCEDDDLGIRLRLAGRRVLSTLGYTHGYHMWHPTEPSRPEKWNDGANVRRLQIDRPIQCVHGLISTSEETDSFPRVAAEISADRSTAKVQDAA
ncbi:MAG TPA: galactosyltransferase-related protein, partial [Lacipirellulaceae bacterium]|nr:galactosyltransferase-related protein [Lacipirellulaceae bacterium]